MPSISPASQKKDARSFSALVTTASASDVIDNATLTALCEGGDLQDTIDSTYVDVAAFVSAFGQEGGAVFVDNVSSGGGGGGGITPIDPVPPPAPSGATISVPLGGDIQTAINAAAPGDRILLAAGTYTVPGALTINKALTLQGAGQAATVVQTAAAAGDPVVLLTISVSNVVVRDLTLKQRKTTNTSIEAAVSITASTGSSGHFLEAVTVETMEFGVVIKSDGWQINNCHLAYVGPNNSTRRLIGIYRSAGQGLFTNSTYNSGQDGIITGNTRVVTVTTGASPPDEVLGGYLRLGNITPSNAFPVHQFFNCDYFAPSGTPLSFVVDGCTSAETSAFVVFAEAVTQPPLAQCALIALQGNTLTNAHGKGAIALNGGAGGPVAPGTTTFYATGNTIASTAFLGAFVTAIDGSADPAVLAQMGYDTLRWTDPNQTITPSVVPLVEAYWALAASRPVLQVTSAGVGAVASVRVELDYSAAS
jgi:hypothetical protein